MSQSRPDIFEYHDYRRFLTDWLAFKKAGQSHFSLRALAKQTGLASGYLPMVLSGKRVLSAAAWEKLAPHIGLSPREKAFFENLLTLGTSDSQSARLTAAEKMKRSSRFRKSSPREAEVYEYLTRWYYVAIREMTALPDFQLNAEWIQERLNFAVSLAEVKTALEFLLDNEFITRDKDGKASQPEKTLDCDGGIYRLALGQFHRQIFDLASKSIDETPSTAREIAGHTVALSPEGQMEARKIMQEAIQKIRDLGQKENKSDSVYHMEIALFPLSKQKRSPR